MWSFCGILPRSRRRGGTTLRMWRTMAITSWLGDAGLPVRRNPFSTPNAIEQISPTHPRRHCTLPPRACQDRPLSRRTRSLPVSPAHPKRAKTRSLPGIMTRQASVDSNETPSSGNKIVSPSSCMRTSSVGTWPPPSTRWRCRVRFIPSWILHSMGSWRTTWKGDFLRMELQERIS